MLSIQKCITLGSGDFSPTYNLNTYRFLLGKKAQTVNKQKLFQANILLVGLKSPLPKAHL
jgi:hypothetical protein